MSEKYHCSCHEKMGNDFYFLPTGECLKGECDAPPSAEHRQWLDKVKVHGPELLDALKQLARHTVANTNDAQDALHRANVLIEKLSPSS